MEILFVLGLVLLAQYLISPKWFKKTYSSKYKKHRSKEQAYEDTFNAHMREINKEINKRTKDARASVIKALQDKKKYFKSAKWRQIRAERLRKDFYCCHLCYAQHNLECHHITYKNFGNENINDLRILCRSCHQSIHDKYGYPENEHDYFNYVFWDGND